MPGRTEGQSGFPGAQLSLPLAYPGARSLPSPLVSWPPSHFGPAVVQSTAGLGGGVGDSSDQRLGMLRE